MWLAEAGASDQAWACWPAGLDGALEAETVVIREPAGLDEAHVTGSAEPCV